MKNYNRLVTRSFATTLTNGVINSLEYPFNRDSIPDETIFIIDGTGLIFLSYFSVEKNLKFGNNIEVENISENLMKNLNISLNSADLKQATLALTTMASMFVSIVKFIKPKYLAIVFDAGSLTFRNTMFPDYKLNRPPVCFIILNLYSIQVNHLGNIILSLSAYILRNLPQWNHCFI
jgi:hypothetical protein